MILDELILHDFGVYQGRQSFPLTPEDPERPIILIGARNGGGKTTFLEGLQLAFFGRLTSGGFRGGVPYDEYLRRAIHRAAPEGASASVEVRFRRTVAGQQQAFWIKRVWSVQKSAVREIFEVWVDGSLDRVLTTQWAEYVEEMLPPRIAPLFFFDGEKIEQFADLDRSSEIIGKAINALLGLDIVERLELDLDVFERRKAVGQTDEGARAELARVAAAAETAQATVHARNLDLGGAKTLRDRRLAQLEQAQAQFKAQGGHLFDAREAILAKGRDFANQLAMTESRLRAWSADVAPLMLVTDLLGDVAQQAEDEAASEVAKAVVTLLGKRDAQTLKRLKQAGANGVIQHEIHSFLEEDRQRLKDQAAGTRYLDLTRTARVGLTALINDGLPSATLARQAFLEDLDQVLAAKDDADREAAAIPAPETVAPLRARLLAEEEALVQAEAAIISAERDLEVAERELGAAQATYQQTLGEQVQTRLQSEDAQRMLEHSARVRATLKKFKSDVVRHHVRRIETLILEALNQLFHKEGLVSRVRIDPDTFALSLKSGGWDNLPPEQLSAGERQLFAIALLWALAKASGQAAPTIIDTPMGRLDSGHRLRLVERYFPYAGRQVILLSTDEEIDQRYYERLVPWISRCLTIDYDSDRRASRVVEGYAFVAPAEEMA